MLCQNVFMGVQEEFLGIKRKKEQRKREMNTMPKRFMTATCPQCKITQMVESEYCSFCKAPLGLQLEDDFPPRSEDIEDVKEIKVTENSDWHLTCGKCGSLIPDDSKFCAFCGEKVQSAKEQYCPSCGKSMEANSKFCPFCGQKL